LTILALGYLKQNCIENLTNDIKNIQIDLKNITNTDIAGFQFVKSIEKYANDNNLKLSIINVQQKLLDKLNKIGATL
jgi:ABC-type transporter Mla MlaB component